MNSTEAYVWCEGIVRERDPDRYAAAVLASQTVRPHLFAIAAFQHEVAKTAEAVSQPVLGQIRLQWWRDTLDSIYAHNVRKSDVAIALADTITVHGLPRALLDEYIDAREADLEAEPFLTSSSLAAYLDASVGNGMRLALRILGAGETEDTRAHDAAIAYGISGILRAFPFWAARRRLILPHDLLGKVDPETIFAGENSAGLHHAIQELAESALAHHARLRKIPRRFLPAFLPAALAPAILRAAITRNFDPFRTPLEISQFQRQALMLRGCLSGRV